jgi:uncharacterized protein
MQRKHINTLDKWLNKAGRKPMIVRGARQVGKSTLVSLLATHSGRPLTVVNLERFPELEPVIAANDPKRFLNVIEGLPGVAPLKQESLLFLDEIQAIPSALPMLRYFYEEMTELPVLAAGSLLEFTLANHPFSMPVGRVEYLNLEPMIFTEFLEALGEEVLANSIRNYDFSASAIEPIFHKRLMGLLKEYYFVGGMPEAVKNYAESRRLLSASEVHASILETYQDDFPKYIGSRDALRMRRVFQIAAKTVAQKVRYTNFSDSDTSKTIKTDIELLWMARLLNKVFHSKCSGLPLQGDINESIYKLLFVDVGLMNAISGTSWEWLHSTDDSSLVNEGRIAEQFIGQHLIEGALGINNRELTYWVREGRSGNAELDYVVALHGSIIPVEVKSGATGSLRSLHQFMAEKKGAVAVRFDANLPSRQAVTAKVTSGGKEQEVCYDLISLPLYLVERLEAVVKKVTLSHSN